jgi:hypothetical protein
MTKLERLKARALMRCRTLPDSWETQFIRSLGYIARVSPETVLTSKQRYTLDLMVWRFRRQLSGRVDLGFELPERPPVEADYERPVRPAPQGSLL